jgi:Bacterial SH3 domain
MRGILIVLSILCVISTSCGESTSPSSSRPAASKDEGGGATRRADASSQPGRTWFAGHNDLAVRGSADDSASSLLRINKGHELTEISRSNGWVEVGVARTGTTGWVPASSITLTRRSGRTRTPESDKFSRFMSAFSTLNQRVKSQAGIELFSGAEDMGDGIVYVTATRAWLSATIDEQSSSLNTVYNLWRAADESGLPVAVYVRDAQGNIVMKKSSP